MAKSPKSKSAPSKSRKRKLGLKLPKAFRWRVRLNPTLRRTLFLMVLMGLLGGFSGLVGYTFGRESLKGITQPALNPVLGDGNDPNRRPRQGVSLLKEDDIIKKVKSQNKSKTGQPSKSPKPSAKPKSDQAKEQKSKDKKKDAQAAKLPVKATSSGMKLTVESFKTDDDDLVLNVALKNDGSDPVKFVYNFLDVTDEGGKFLPVEVQGLPETLNASSETFYGTIRILDGVSDKLKKVSLKLTNYPDQDIKLEAQNIPVTK